MTVTIHQIPVTNRMADDANAGNMSEALETRCRLMINAGDKFQSEMFKYYAPTFEVETDDLEHAFYLTNMWSDENLVTVVREEGCSSSVGDIFELEGKFFICDSFGFKEVELTH